MNKLVLGMFRGDEGKGKIVDYYGKNAQIVIRFNGSCNAGHTLVRNGQRLVLHQIPSAIISGVPCLIAHGCLVNVNKLLAEIVEVERWSQAGLIDLKGKRVTDLLKIAYGCHVITDEHIALDISREENGLGNGSTKQGISPAYADKYLRSGKRIIDCIDAIHHLSGMLVDDTTYLNSLNLVDAVFEGAQGVMLDIDSAYYPNVSSSSVGVGGVLAGTGLSWKNLTKNGFEVIGVAKAYMTSVGDGYFPTEVKCYDEKYEFDPDDARQISHEFGATTGRPRKIGYLDLAMLKYSARISGTDRVVFTCLDTVRKMFKGKDIPVCTCYSRNGSFIPVRDFSIYDLESYEPRFTTLPCWEKEDFSDKNFRKFVNVISRELPVDCVSIGPGQNELLFINGNDISFWRFK